jgi:hypothetical protein
LTKSGLRKIRKFLFLFYTFLIVLISEEGRARVYEIGPEKEFSQISQVPLDSLNPGDTVKFFFREKPYQEKFIIRRSGRKNNPIRIMGVPHNGKLPVLEGSMAVQFQKDKSEQSGRWLIKIGDDGPGDFVEISNLYLRNANNRQQFIEYKTIREYAGNASGVFVKYGRNVTISGCVIQSCGNGVQTSYAPNVANVVLDNCTLFDNGNFKNRNSFLEHNVYLCGINTRVQFCRFGEPHSDGNNIKDRGVNTVIRHNWIEGGKNRQIDFVDHAGYGKADAYVYGNVIIQGDNIHNRNMIHWGGDSGGSRAGTLFFFNNTVIGKSQEALYFMVRFMDCRLWLVNNAFVGMGLLWNGTGGLTGSNNWFSNNINIPPRGLGESGLNPMFKNLQGVPFVPGVASPLVNSGTSSLPLKLEFMPKPNGGGYLRPKDNQKDIGAYESTNQLTVYK